MENYQGIKFKTHHIHKTLETNEQLRLLNRWITLMGDLGLAPVHPEGAYGNHSYRISADTFIITRTGMVPQDQLNPENYCRVRYNEQAGLFEVEGSHHPSSECFMHNAIYASNQNINTILHGHCRPLNTHAQPLSLPITSREYPYGTIELAQAALARCTSTESFFILKNHGFVATGEDIESTGKSVLKHYGLLIEHLRTGG